MLGRGKLTFSPEQGQKESVHAPWLDMSTPLICLIGSGDLIAFPCFNIWPTRRGLNLTVLPLVLSTILEDRVPRINRHLLLSI